MLSTNSGSEKKEVLKIREVLGVENTSKSHEKRGCKFRCKRGCTSICIKLSVDNKLLSFLFLVLRRAV